MSPKLTAAQQESLRRDVDLAVTAGAGTGKTLVLVSRYLDILLGEDIDIRNILAITFTNKAATEMLERIATTLDRHLQNPEYHKNQQRLSTIRNRLSSAYISTIHSFCTRLLRENPLQAGIDPDFIVLDEMETDLLISETIREEFEALNTNPNQFLELFRLLGSTTIEQMLRLALSHRYSISKIGEWYMTAQGESLENTMFLWFDEYISKVVPEKIRHQFQVTVETIVKSGRSGHESNEADEIYHLLQNYLSKSMVDWTLFTQITNRFTRADHKAYTSASRLGGKSAWNNPDDLTDLSRVAASVRKHMILPPDESGRKYLQALQRFFLLFEQCRDRYIRQKMDRRALDFEDLQILTVRLLENDELRRHMQRQFRYIMVDEFQDTNPLQFKIIDFIHQKQENKLFVVGDPKQSIYGFRNADVRVFTQIQKEFDRQRYTKNIYLEESFRFKEKLNRFYNDIFPHVFDGDSEWDVPFQSSKTVRDDRTGGEVELGLFEFESGGANQPLYISDKINSLNRENNIEYGDIAILLRSRGHLNEIEDALRSAAIPFQTIGGVGFYQRQEIYDIYNLLHFLIDPHNDSALVAVLRSPFASISDEGLYQLAVQKDQPSYWNQLKQMDQMENVPADDRKKFIRFRRLADKWTRKKDRVGFHQLLSEIFYESSYAGIMAGSIQGDRLLANIRKVLDMAMHFESAGFLSLSDFAGYIQRLINRESQEGEAWIDSEENRAVTVMTIHQAKGLEFPIVFVPYLEQNIKKAGRAGIYIDEKYGISAPLRRQQSHFLHDLLKKRMDEKELAEYKRIFYVACTRARDYLFLSGEYKKNKIPVDSPLAWLLEATGLDPDSEDTHRKCCEMNIQSRKPKARSSRTATLSTIQKKLKHLQQRPSDAVVPLTALKTQDTPKGETYSATQLMTFLRDENEYYQRYFLGYFEGDYDRLLLDQQSADLSLLKGKIIHRFLETYPDFDLPQILLEYEIADRRIQELIAEDLQVIRDRIDHSIWLKPILNAKKYRNEVTIHMKLGTDYLTGTLDRMYSNSKDSWEIIDYKTNKVSKAELPHIISGYSVQSETYALLISHLFPNQSEYRVNFYFIHPDQLLSNVYTVEETRKLAAKFLTTLSAMKKLHDQNSTL